MIAGAISSALLFNSIPIVATEGSGTVEITGHIPSSYTISIPAHIEINDYGFGEVSIQDANLETGAVVNVYCSNVSNGLIPLTNTYSGAQGNCYLMNSDAVVIQSPDEAFARFTKEDIQNGMTQKAFTLRMVEGGEAGDYTGNMTYTFALTKN